MHRLSGKAPHTAQSRLGQRRIVVPLGQVWANPLLIMEEPFATNGRTVSLG